jgi:hypothetical protein
VVAGRNTDHPFSLCQPVIFLISLHKQGSVSPSLPGKIRMLTAEQVHVMGRPEMEKEIHVEPSHQGFVRLSPFRNHHRIRVILVQKSPHILPEFHRLLMPFIIFNQGGCHVHPKPVTSLGKPEIHHIFHGLPGL